MNDGGGGKKMKKRRKGRRGPTWKDNKGKELPTFSSATSSQPVKRLMGAVMRPRGAVSTCLTP